MSTIATLKNILERLGDQSGENLFENDFAGVLSRLGGAAGMGAGSSADLIASVFLPIPSVSF